MRADLFIMRKRKYSCFDSIEIDCCHKRNSAAVAVAAVDAVAAAAAVVVAAEEVVFVAAELSFPSADW